MKDKEFMKQSLCRFQFTPSEVESHAIDKNFNFYSIHIFRGQTLISLETGTSLKNVATLNHVQPIMTFESKDSNKVVTLICSANLECINKLIDLKQALEV